MSQNALCEMDEDHMPRYISASGDGVHTMKKNGNLDHRQLNLLYPQRSFHCVYLHQWPGIFPSPEDKEILSTPFSVKE